ncbi:MAG TPA: homocysteine S-methyltransferase family protein [Candidatus Bipolaricaulota bacterium]
MPSPHTPLTLSHTMSVRVSKPFSQLWSRSVILLDGALGTELEKLIPAPRLPWSLDGLIFNPQLTQRLHERYLQAGADVITANAFRTNGRTLRQVRWNQVQLPETADAALKEVWAHGRWEELEGMLTCYAVQLAQSARRQLDKEDEVCIAGNLAPLEDCFSPQRAPSISEAYAEHRRKAQCFAQAGVDLILIETMGTLGEAEGALEAALDTSIPVWISFVARGGALLSGESFSQGFAMLKAHLPSSLCGVLLNCCEPEEIDALLPRMASAFGGSSVRVGAYANVQAPDQDGVWRRRADMSTNAYARRAQQWVERGASIVGGCCGTTPQDIAALQQRFKLTYHDDHPRIKERR